MKREEVVRIMEAARSKGERPNLSEFDLNQTDLSGLDLSEA